MIDSIVSAGLDGPHQAGNNLDVELLLVLSILGGAELESTPVVHLSYVSFLLSFFSGRVSGASRGISNSKTSTMEIS
jgi:hypothetical protein